MHNDKSSETGHLFFSDIGSFLLEAVTELRSTRKDERDLPLIALR